MPLHYPYYNLLRTYKYNFEYVNIYKNYLFKFYNIYFKKKIE